MTTPGWYPDPLGGPGTRHWNGTQWDEVPGAPPPEAYPSTEPSSGERKWRRLLVPALLVIVGLLTGVLAVVLWPKGETPKPEPVASPSTTITTSSLSPTDAAASAVKASMQHKFDSDPDLSGYGLKVIDVVLVNKSGNEYKGIATVKTRDGDKHDVSIDVTADQNDTIWEAAPGAFKFLLSNETPSPPPPPKAAPPPAAAPTPPDVEDITICPSGLSAVASDDTSCAFADSVRASWYSRPGPVIIAYSPVTGQTYKMLCAPAVTTQWRSAQRCSGKNAYGATLTVYFG